MPTSVRCPYLVHCWLVIALCQALPLCERLSLKGALEPGVRVALHDYKSTSHADQCTNLLLHAVATLLYYGHG